MEAILAQELERWQTHYHEENKRHLFVELPYYTAELLNLFLQAEDDGILDAVYEDWEGTASHVPAVKEFYRQLKETCPETIFHGTDVGHQYSNHRGAVPHVFGRHRVIEYGAICACRASD